MKKLLIATIVVVVVAGLYFGLGGKDKLAQITSDLDLSSEESPAPIEEQEIVVEPDKIFAEPVTFSALKQSYSGNSFSFKYSEGFKVSSVPVNAAQEIVTIENTKGSGFQIFIMFWDESGSITPERIWQDMPDADVIDPKNAQLDGVKTLVFYGYNEDMGETFEAWVVYKGKLYQISGPKTAEQLVIETLETWEWK